MASAGYVRKKMKCMRQSKQAHCVLIVDGDQAHIEQGLDAFKFTLVRIPHPDSDTALVWEESIG